MYISIYVVLCIFKSEIKIFHIIPVWLFTLFLFLSTDSHKNQIPCAFCIELKESVCMCMCVRARRPQKFHQNGICGKIKEFSLSKPFVSQNTFESVFRAFVFHL